MASPVVTNTDVALDGKTLLLVETSANITGGLIPNSDAVQVGWMLRKVVTLTNTQIKTLPTNPVTIIPSVSVGNRIKLLGATLLLKFSAGAYTNINTTYATVQLDIAGAWMTSPIVNDTSLTTDLTRVTSYFGATNILVDMIVPYEEAIDSGSVSGDSYWPQPAIANFPDNTALTLSFDNNGSGNLTGGNSANTLKVSCYYVIEAV